MRAATTVLGAVLSMRRWAFSTAFALALWHPASGLAQRAGPAAVQSLLSVRPDDGGIYCELLPPPDKATLAQRDALDRQGCVNLLNQRKEAPSRCLVLPVDTEQRCQRVGESSVRRPWIAGDINPWLADKDARRVVDQVQQQGSPGTQKQSYVWMPFARRGSGPELLVAKRPADPGMPPCESVNGSALGVYAMLKPDAALNVHKASCTLTRIAQGQFLTAAHCLKDMGERALALVEKSPQPPHNWVGTELSCKVPKGFELADFGDPDKDASRMDIAVCTVTRGASPVKFDQARLMTDRDALNKLVPKKVLLAGVGYNENSERGLVSFGQTLFARAPAPDSQKPKSHEGTDIYKGKVDGQKGCMASGRETDSGGAVYSPGDLNDRQLIGIISDSRITESQSYFVSFAKRGPCEFLKKKGALSASTNCAAQTIP